MTIHAMTPEGESTENWALRSPGFVGSTRQLLDCARCGDPLPVKPHSEPRHFGVAPVLHVICDDCHDALPD